MDSLATIILSMRDKLALWKARSSASHREHGHGCTRVKVGRGEGWYQLFGRRTTVSRTRGRKFREELFQPSRSYKDSLRSEFFRKRSFERRSVERGGCVG